MKRGTWGWETDVSLFQHIGRIYLCLAGTIVLGVSIPGMKQSLRKGLYFFYIV